MNAYKITFTRKEEGFLLPTTIIFYKAAHDKWEAEYYVRQEFYWQNEIGYEIQKTERIPLYVNEYVIQQHFGRWEDMTSEENLKEARIRLNEYRINQPQYPARRIIRKVLNPLVGQVVEP